MRYIATANTPGCLPQSDDQAVFDTAPAAWEALAEERKQEEEGTEDDADEYSGTVDTLTEYAENGHGPDTVYGPTPGSDGQHDLGTAYTVARFGGMTDEELFDIREQCDGMFRILDTARHIGLSPKLTDVQDHVWECVEFCREQNSGILDIGPQCLEGHPIGECSKCDTATEPWYNRLPPPAPGGRGTTSTTGE